MDRTAEGFSRVKTKKQKLDIIWSKRLAGLQCLVAGVFAAGVLTGGGYMAWPYLQPSVSVAVSEASNRTESPLILGGGPAPAVSLTLPQRQEEKQAVGKKKEALSGHRIVVHLPSRKLDYYQGEHLIKTYPVAVGKPSTPTPTGSYVIERKEVNPWWYPPKDRGKVVPSGPSNPLGYRWMEFAPMYGIHGTNTPWEIGGAVSNGCIRMREGDVEELYDQVPRGTLVHIVYDMVRVHQEKDGMVTVGLYPDIYGYSRPLSVELVQQRLAEAGFKGLVPDETVKRLLREERGRQVPVLQVSRVKINGKWAEGYAVRVDSQVLVPVWPAASLLKAQVFWQPGDSQVQVGDTKVSAFVKGEVLYVTLGGLQQLFGGMWLWHPVENVRELVLPNWGGNG